MNPVADLTNRLETIGEGGTAARWQKWLPTAISYVLVILLAWLAARLVWQMVDLFLDTGDDGVNAVVVADAPTSEDKVSSLAGIAWKNYQLFGTEPDGRKKVEAPKATAPKPKPPPEPVKVKLYGTIASTEPKGSLAVLSVKSQPSEIFRVGDEIQTGVTLKTVNGRSVVLLAGGEDVVIPIEEKTISTVSPVAPVRKSPLTGRPAGRAANEQISNPDVARKLNDYRKTLSTNPLSLTGKLRLYPVERNGVGYGVRVRPGTDRALLGQIGLRSGDIVTSINGVSTSDVANLSDVIAQLRDQREIRVEFERGGKPQEMNLVLDNSGGR